MRIARTITLAIAMLVSPVAHAAITVSSTDNGGVVITRMSAWAGKSVIVSAPCKSACAAAALQRRTDVCWKPGAQFVVHAPSGVGARLNSITKAIIMNAFKPRIRSWVIAHGGLTSEPLTVPLSLVRRCQ